MIRRIWNNLHSTGPRWRFRLVADATVRVGDFGLAPNGCRTDLNKEELSRGYILANKGSRLSFLDVGGREGDLKYLLGNRTPLKFSRKLYQWNKDLFLQKYDYFGFDLKPAGSNVIVGDICSPAFSTPRQFDVVYSNNVFEHLERPWEAARNILSLLKPRGLCVTIAPFSQRYHEVPGDYFRYTPTGLAKLFEIHQPIEVLESGFDTRARRYDWQGSGAENDIVPVDYLGAWRETWFSVLIFRKPRT